MPFVIVPLSILYTSFIIFSPGYRTTENFPLYPSWKPDKGLEKIFHKTPNKTNFPHVQSQIFHHKGTIHTHTGFTVNEF